MISIPILGWADDLWNSNLPDTALSAPFGFCVLSLLVGFVRILPFAPLYLQPFDRTNKFPLTVVACVVTLLSIH